MQQNACSVSQSLLIVTWSKHTGPFVFVAAAVVVCIAIPRLQKIQQINNIPMVVLSVDQGDFIVVE